MKFLAVKFLAAEDSLPGILQAVSGIVDSFGYLIVGLFLVLQNAGVPFIPAWTSMMAAAVFASAGKLNVFVLAAVAIISTIIGSNIGFAIGRYGGEPLVLKYGRYVYLTPKRLHIAHRFLNKYGGPIVAFGPLINGVFRQFGGIVTGTAEMRWRKFAIYNALGTILWVSVWITIAYWASNHLGAIYRGVIRYDTYALVLFGGYAIGRISHILGGHLKAPHHWIYGMISLIVGIIFIHRALGPYLIAFGIGHTISDLKDMIELKFYGVDPPGPKKFWGID